VAISVVPSPSDRLLGASAVLMLLFPRSSEFAPSACSSYVVCRLGGQSFVLVGTPCHTMDNADGCLSPYGWLHCTLGKKSLMTPNQQAEPMETHPRMVMPKLQMMSPVWLRELQQHQTHKARYDNYLCCDLYYKPC